MTLDTAIVKILDCIARQAGESEKYNDRDALIKLGYGHITRYTTRHKTSDYVFAAYVHKFEELLACYRRKEVKQ